MSDSLFPASDLDEDELVAAYLEHLSSGSSDDPHGVRFHVGSLIHLGPREQGWAVLSAAIDRASDEQVLCNIGAGDLEDLLVFHGAEWIDTIEARAATSENLRTALKCVWGGDPEVRARVDAIIARE